MDEDPRPICVCGGAMFKTFAPLPTHFQAPVWGTHKEWTVDGYMRRQADKPEFKAGKSQFKGSRWV